MTVVPAGDVGALVARGLTLDTVAEAQAVPVGSAVAPDQPTDRSEEPA